MSVARILPAIKAGRCANGFERDGGRRVHAVPYTGRADYYHMGKSLCGTSPGRHSAGWSSNLQKAVTCARCKRELAKLPKEQRPLSAEELSEAAVLFDDRPPVLPGTKCIPDQRAREGWYARVTEKIGVLELSPGQVRQFCDRAGVAD